jgi:hypothetical protein
MVASKNFMKDYSYILKMNATWSFRIETNFQWPTYRYLPKARTFHKHQCKNLKSYITIMFFEFKLNYAQNEKALYKTKVPWIMRKEK